MRLIWTDNPGNAVKTLKPQIYGVIIGDFETFAQAGQLDDKLVKVLRPFHLNQLIEKEKVGQVSRKYLTLKVEAQLGMSRLDAFEEAFAVAKQVGVVVEFDYNDEICSITPEGVTSVVPRQK